MCVKNYRINLNCWHSSKFDKLASIKLFNRWSVCQTLTLTRPSISHLSSLKTKFECQKLFSNPFRMNSFICSSLPASDAHFSLPHQPNIQPWINLINKGCDLKISFHPSIDFIFLMLRESEWIIKKIFYPFQNEKRREKWE